MSRRKRTRVHPESTLSLPLSIVIPHYGDPEPTKALVESLRRQTVADRFEIIVVDDASTEPLPQICGATVLRQERNRGFGTTVNRGVEVALGEQLLILNSDVEVESTFVADLLERSERWGNVVAAPAVRWPDGRSDLTGRRWPTNAQLVIGWLVPFAGRRDTRRLQRAMGFDHRAMPGSTTSVDWAVGCALLVSSSAFREVGGFDERFYMNSEEVDLQRRLTEIGVPTIYFGDVTVIHDAGGSSDPARQRQWIVQARLRYAEKWGGLRRLQAGLTGATIVNCAWNAARRIAGRQVSPLKEARSDLELIWRTR